MEKGHWTFNIICNKYVAVHSLPHLILMASWEVGVGVIVEFP